MSTKSKIEMAATAMLFGECELELTKWEKDFILNVTNVIEQHWPKAVLLDGLTAKQLACCEKIAAKIKSQA